MKIKILFFQWKLVFGGTESALFDLLRLMDKEAFDITLFVMEEGGVWDKKFTDAGIKVIGPYTELNSKKGSISDAAYCRLKKKIDKSIKNFCIHLLDVCSTEKWDIVVAYHPSNYRLGVFPKKTKTVFYLHMDPEHYQHMKDDMHNSPDYYKAFDKIIAVSNYAKNSFSRISGINNNIVVHFNPIDREAIIEKSNEKKELDFSFPYVCAIGRLSIQKGFERLIRIHKKIIDEGFFHHLVIVGEGERRENIEKVIADVHAEDTVVLTGFQDNPYPFIKNSKLLVVSSYHEGLCMAAMEAIILGIPVVSTIPTIDELSGDENCSIVTELDDNSLYFGLRKMLSDQEFYQAAKEAAQRRSLFFDGGRMTKEVEEEFKTLYLEKTDYRKKRKFVRSEYKKARKSRNHDLKHLPNRVIRRIVGIRIYNIIKFALKK